jgi:hypothetical protein
MVNHKVVEQPRLQTPHILPPFSLQIPVEFRQKIAFNSHHGFNKLASICFGLNLNGANYQFNSAGGYGGGNSGSPTASSNTIGYLRQAQHQLNVRHQQQQQQQLMFKQQQQQQLQRQRQLQLHQQQQQQQRLSRNVMGQNKIDIKKKVVKNNF